MYPIKGHSFNSFVISAHFAVCSFSPKEVLSELVQPPGPHCSSPSRVPPASGTICGLLVDRQKGGSLQFLISCSGKGSLIRMFHMAIYAAAFHLSVRLRDKIVITLHKNG